ncbi:unnamed protein product [Chrysoparadoxa australica]
MIAPQFAVSGNHNHHVVNLDHARHPNRLAVLGANGCIFCVMCASARFYNEHTFIKRALISQLMNIIVATQGQWHEGHEAYGYIINMLLAGLESNDEGLCEEAVQGFGTLAKFQASPNAAPLLHALGERVVGLGMPMASHHVYCMAYLLREAPMSAGAALYADVNLPRVLANSLHRAFSEEVLANMVFVCLEVLQMVLKQVAARALSEHDEVHTMVPSEDPLLQLLKAIPQLLREHVGSSSPAATALQLNLVHAAATAISWADMKQRSQVHGWTSSEASAPSTSDSNDMASLPPPIRPLFFSNDGNANNATLLPEVVKPLLLKGADLRADVSKLVHYCCTTFPCTARSFVEAGITNYLCEAISTEEEISILCYLEALAALSKDPSSSRFFQLPNFSPGITYKLLIKVWREAEEFEPSSASSQYDQGDAGARARAEQTKREDAEAKMVAMELAIRAMEYCPPDSDSGTVEALLKACSTSNARSDHHGGVHHRTRQSAHIMGLLLHGAVPIPADQKTFVAEVLEAVLAGLEDSLGQYQENPPKDLLDMLVASLALLENTIHFISERMGRQGYMVAAKVALPGSKDLMASSELCVNALLRAIGIFFSNILGHASKAISTDRSDVRLSFISCLGAVIDVALTYIYGPLQTAPKQALQQIVKLMDATLMYLLKKDLLTWMLKVYFSTAEGSSNEKADKAQRSLDCGATPGATCREVIVSLYFACGIANELFEYSTQASRDLAKVLKMALVDWAQDRTAKMGFDAYLMRQIEAFDEPPTAWVPLLMLTIMLTPGMGILSSHSQFNLEVGLCLCRHVTGPMATTLCLGLLSMVEWRHGGGLQQRAPAFGSEKHQAGADKGGCTPPRVLVSSVERLVARCDANSLLGHSSASSFKFLLGVRSDVVSKMLRGWITQEKSHPLAVQACQQGESYVTAALLMLLLHTWRDACSSCNNGQGQSGAIDLVVLQRSTQLLGRCGQGFQAALAESARADATVHAKGETPLAEAFATTLSRTITVLFSEGLTLVSSQEVSLQEVQTSMLDIALVFCVQLNAVGRSSLAHELHAPCAAAIRWSFQPRRWTGAPPPTKQFGHCCSLVLQLLSMLLLEGSVGATRPLPQTEMAQSLLLAKEIIAESDLCSFSPRCIRFDGELDPFYRDVPGFLVAFMSSLALMNLTAAPGTKLMTMPVPVLCSVMSKGGPLCKAQAAYLICSLAPSKPFLSDQIQQLEIALQGAALDAICKVLPEKSKASRTALSATVMALICLQLSDSSASTLPWNAFLLEALGAASTTAGWSEMTFLGPSTLHFIGITLMPTSAPERGEVLQQQLMGLAEAVAAGFLKVVPSEENATIVRAYLHALAGLKRANLLSVSRSNGHSHSHAQGSLSESISAHLHKHRRGLAAAAAAAASMGRGGSTGQAAAFTIAEQCVLWPHLGALSIADEWWIKLLLSPQPKLKKGVDDWIQIWC